MDIIEMIKYSVPALIVFFTAFFMMRYYMQKEARERKVDLVIRNQQTITPLRLQAYERLALFLERINPESMLMRVNQPGMNSQQLQSQLLATIRAEFEHNLSQQIYITPQAWEVVKNAKNNTIKLINTSADKVKPNAPAMELNRHILEKVIETEAAPSQAALEFLKKEVSTFF
ncbi:MAG TPA: hypothetical protein ENN63_11515 [Bacteroidetes bacterium]|nr:hypothetical protein [Bacteroidota bacterium]